MHPPTAEPLRALEAILTADAWVVGGAVRDELLGRAFCDVDVAVDEPPERPARALAAGLRGFAFELSEGFGGWRVVDHARSWQVDLVPLVGGSLATDLAARDLTINAMARPLGRTEIVDPHRGRDDLCREILRGVSTGAFTADPLRVMRLARLHSELGFRIDAATAAQAVLAAPGLGAVAPERVLSELLRLLRQPRAVSGLEAMDALGATAAVLPELVALEGVEQSQYHHLDVGRHTRAVLAETVALTAEPGARFEALGPQIEALLAEPLANELTRGEGLRLGALLHDSAKPQTRAVTDTGRITFLDHDRQGAALVETILRRLRASERLVGFVSALVRHHLRAGFLVHEMPLDRRAIYRYLRATEPVEVEVTLLSVADRLATQGRGAEAAIRRHLEVADLLLTEGLRWRAARPRPPLRGDDLAQALGITPGPELGRLLAELEQAAFAGELADRDAALALARTLLERSAGTER
jgi:poly(A) polymerase